jgi:ATP-dependent helicase/nuclease subunit B
VTITRHFQGWETASLPAATALLTQNWVQSGCTGPLDLRHTLILVPTRHAGRRLRGELARIAAEKGTAVLAGAIVTPEHLLPLPPNTAPEDLALAMVTRLLMDRHSDYGDLLPNRDIPWDSFSFALGIASQLQDVRRQLNEANRTAAEMIPRVPAEEKARWENIAAIEQGLIQALEKLGQTDPLQARLNTARSHPGSVPFSQIHALFIPDLTEWAARTLETLSAGCDVALHVLAPESEANRFDDWGRPLPDQWESVPLPIPENSIHIYGQSGDEIAALAGLVTEAEDRHQALALCTPDPASAQALARRLEMEGRELYLPNGIPLNTTAPGRLLTDWLTLLRQGDYASTAVFLRNPDAQDWLAATADPCPVPDLLEELDACQNEHLPATFEEVRRFSRNRFPALADALETIHKSHDLPLAEFLAELYDCRASHAPDDPLFADAAQALTGLILQAEAAAEQTNLSAGDLQDLLLAALQTQQIFPKPNTAESREALGWLEIQWETAPALVLSEMREGVIPETRVGDAFLPDSIRVAAGIAGNRQSLARDLYLTRTLLESRPNETIHFLFSRRSASQDPQLPSRILTACPNEELPGRIARLFEHPALHAQEKKPGPPALQLVPPPCTVEDIPTKLSVTSFSAYLSCPFRFYLSRILRMRSSEDSARELNALAFGSLAHEMLEQLAQHPNLTDEYQIRDLLLADLDRRFMELFGKRPSLVLTVQLESLRQRLGAAARVQAQSVQEGWQITSGEQKFTATLEGMEIHGRIDRIERHKDGRVRILDYKTSDSGTEPLKAHYQSSNRIWVDLQLPLYRYMYAQDNPEAPTPEVGYFNLPKAVAETDIFPMNFVGKDGDLYEPAIDAARQVVKDIQAGLFWPPAKVKPDWDDFSALSPQTQDLIQQVLPL